jgi:hypothetical protein
MLRGLSLGGTEYPFYSLDSTNIARNHHRSYNDPFEMMKRIDAKQNPGKWNAMDNDAIELRKIDDEARQKWLAELNEHYSTNPNTGLMIMPRPKASVNKAKAAAAASQSNALLNALEFVGVVPTRSLQPRIGARLACRQDWPSRAMAFVSAGHPIAEELTTCSHNMSG